MNPSPEQIRSRQTAYLATEHWWRSRVEEIAAKFHADAADCRAGAESDVMDTEGANSLFAYAYMLDKCARELDALLALRLR